MTVAELREALTRYPDQHDVVLAGDGRLCLVTHGATEDERRVVVLYVEAPDPVPDPAPSAQETGQPQDDVIQDGTHVGGGDDE